MTSSVFKQSLRYSIGPIVGRVFMWGWMLVALVPIVFILMTSLKPAGLVNQIPPAWVFPITFENYANVLATGDSTVSFGQMLLNSALLSTGATLLTVAVAVPAAYALSMRSFAPRQKISNWVLSTYMFPPIVAVIPIFVFAGKLGLIDTVPVLLVPYAAFNLPIAVWILRSSILQIPFEIQEAAMVDGASSWAILRRVVLPLLVPSMATVAVLTLVLTWNEFLFALALTRSFVKTAPVGLQQFTGIYEVDWGSISAGSMLIVAPVLVLTVALRRQMVSGLSFGAVK